VSKNRHRVTFSTYLSPFRAFLAGVRFRIHPNRRKGFGRFQSVCSRVETHVERSNESAHFRDISDIQIHFCSIFICACRCTYRPGHLLSAPVKNAASTAVRTGSAYRPERFCQDPAKIRPECPVSGQKAYFFKVQNRAFLDQNRPFKAVLANRHPSFRL